MAKDPQYPRRHYEDVARIMRDKRPVGEENTHEYQYWAGIVARFHDLFAADNPKFDAVRFIDACKK